MSYPLIRGATNLPLEQPYKEQFSPSKGNIITRTYRGSLSDLDTLITSFVADGYEYTLTQDGKGGLWTLVATIGADDPESNFEISGVEEQHDLLSSTNPYIQQLSQRNIQILRVNERFYADFKGKTPAPAPGTGTDEANTFYFVWACIMAGQRKVPVALTVVRRSYIASRQWQITESALFINRIFSKSSLIGDLGIPQTYWPVMPDSGADYIGPLPVNYGYQKKSPKIELVSNNRIRVSIEYHFNAWSALFGSLL